MTRVLAIDPGFGRIGVAVLERQDGKEVLVFSDCITTSAELSFPKRLSFIVVELKSIIKKYAPECLAIEKLFFTTNQKTAMKVAEARGAIISCAQEFNLKILEYTPLEVKVAITGYGKATKPQVAKMVSKLISLKKKPKHDDEVDAIAVGLTCLATLKNRV